MVGALAFLYVLFYFMAWGDYKVAKTVEQDPTIPHVTLEDVTMHVETFGNDTNEVVIIIHGGPGNDFRYLLDLKALADNYFVVFYDQRGTGLSPRVPGEELTLQNLLNDLYNLTQYYGQGRKVNIIGHSWGGILASAYTTQHPETINKLVLAEPGPLSPEMAAVYEANMQLEVSLELLTHIGKCYFKSLHVEEIDDQARGDFFFRAFAMDTTISNHPMSAYFCDGDISNMKTEIWRFSGTSSYQIMFKGQDKEAAMDFLNTGKIFTDQILLLAGECNQLIGPDFQKEQMKQFADIDMVVIENAGHFMFSEQPAACLEAIRSYFNE